MKQKKLRLLKDSATFKLSEKSKVFYTLDKVDKKMGRVIYTSKSSGRTFYGDPERLVYVL